MRKKHILFLIIAIIVLSFNAVVFATESGENIDNEINEPIEKIQIEKPWLEYSSISYEYTGEEISLESVKSMIEYDVESYENNLYSIIGDTGSEVGTYKLFFVITDKDNYEWSDGTTDDVEIEWKITKRQLSIPYKNWGTYEYNGKEQTLSKGDLRYFDTNLMTLSNNKAIEIGTHYATVSLKDKNNYEWEDGTAEDKEVEWEIVHGEISITLIQRNAAYQVEYTGEEINIIEDVWRIKDLFEEYPDDIEIVSGSTATERGKYELVLKLTHKERYQWYAYDKENENYYYTIEDQTIEWEITKNSLTIPKYIDHDSYWNNERIEYNGKEQDAVATYSKERYGIANFNNNTMSITGNTGKDIGKYTAIVSLKDTENYEWEDGTTEDKEIEWEIHKISVYRSYSENCKYSYSGQNILFDRYNDARVKIVSGGTAKEVGTYMVTLGLVNPELSEWAISESNSYPYTYSYTTDDQEVEWEIIICTLTLPRQRNNANQYNGNYQEAKLYYFDNSTMSITGNIEKDVGTYKAIVSLKDKENYQWEIYDSFL